MNSPFGCWLYREQSRARATGSSDSGPVRPRTDTGSRFSRLSAGWNQKESKNTRDPPFNPSTTLRCPPFSFQLTEAQSRRSPLSSARLRCFLATSSWLDGCISAEVLNGLHSAPFNRSRAPLRVSTDDDREAGKDDEKACPPKTHMRGVPVFVPVTCDRHSGAEPRNRRSSIATFSISPRSSHPVSSHQQPQHL